MKLVKTRLPKMMMKKRIKKLHIMMHLVSIYCLSVTSLIFVLVFHYFIIYRVSGGLVLIL